MANLRRLLAIGSVLVALIIGVVAYNVFKAPAQATAPLEAIPLARSDATTVTATPAAAAVEGETPAATVAAPELTTVATPEVIAAAETATSAAEQTSSPAATEAAAAASAPVVARIVQEESEVRFLIDEVLNGSPKTVVGTTNQVAGEIAIDPSDPTKSRVGIIQVNARTLTTDSGMRNRAIKNRILHTDQYELITFTPKQIVGLPEQGRVGESYSFQMIGDLTIRDVTREVTFDVTVNPVSETRIEGTAQTTIRHADYGITIPSVPQVANVSPEVRLELDFVAAAS